MLSFEIPNDGAEHAVIIEASGLNEAPPLSSLKLQLFESGQFASIDSMGEFQHGVTGVQRAVYWLKKPGQYKVYLSWLGPMGLEVVSVFAPLSDDELPKSVLNSEYLKGYAAGETEVGLRAADRDIAVLKRKEYEREEAERPFRQAQERQRQEKPMHDAMLGGGYVMPSTGR